MKPWLKAAAIIYGVIIVVAFTFITLSFDSVRAREIAQERPLPPRPEDTCDTAKTLQGLVSSVRVGDGIDVGPFLVYPLRAKIGVNDQSIISMDEAISKGWLKIDEKDGGNVPTLVVSNTGPKSVLLMAGEMVTGGRQNRIINQDTLVPPKTYALAIPVYCGEQSRWSYGEKQDFGSGGWVAIPSTRKRAVAKEGQSEVWADIDSNLGSQNAAAPTRSLQELKDLEGNVSKIEEYDKRVAPKLPDDTIGIAVVYKGRIVGIDLFGSTALCKAEIDKLIYGYICQGWTDSKPEGVSKAEIEKALGQISKADFAFQSTAGQGCSSRFSAAGLTGEALINDGKLVHIVALE